MFGGKKLQEANAQLDALRRELEREKSARTDAERQLSSVRSKVSELEAELKNSELEELKEKAKATIAEYEGLKALYNRKISEFDGSREEKEQAFAREEALQRHSLENEIRDNRQANQDYVASTVRTFSESYNYYLTQIKTLMDALGKVAERTGSALFAAENADLKEQFGLQMVEELKAGLDGMHNEDGDRILIGTAEEPEEEPACDEAEAPCCDKTEPEAPCCEEAEAPCCEETEPEAPCCEEAEAPCCEETEPEAPCCEAAEEACTDEEKCCCEENAPAAEEETAADQEAAPVDYEEAVRDMAAAEGQENA